MNNITISFRNSYPPKMRVAPKNTVIIIQQPWEYHGMPRYWIPYFQTTANEVWVPTHYCKNSLIANGLSPDKIHVISHGVYYDKFQLDLDKLALPTKKKFKFLTVGGLLLRKGIDVMIKAYTSVFTRNDDVTLIIHCIYSLGYNDDYIKKVQENPNSPEIVFIQEPLSEIDMIRLFKSVDVYVSPYRSEGFGLTILEAMAAGLPPIVTNSGASLDFCPKEGVYFIDAEEVACLEYPCGHMKAFQYPTFVQPMWAEPSVKSLAEKMNESFKFPKILRQKAKFVREFARNYTWDNIIDQILKRIFYLVDRHVNYNF